MRIEFGIQQFKLMSSSERGLTLEISASLSLHGGKFQPYQLADTRF